jgi:ABC-type oligopeptide transport system ATPase subunit
MTPLFQPTDQPTIMRNERLRMRRESAEVIEGARQTIAQSRALIVEADAILAAEKHCRITPHLTSQSLSAFDA